MGGKGKSGMKYAGKKVLKISARININIIVKVFYLALLKMLANKLGLFF